MTTTTAIREHPLLMNGPMVRATKLGLKTQTRRIANTYPLEGSCTGHVVKLPRDHSIETDWRAIPYCPYGGIGDRLWIRECWRTHERPEDGVDGILFRADGEFMPIEPTREAGDRWLMAHKWKKHKGLYRSSPDWRPSIHMPRWACRLILEITEVRIQPLQGISLEDVRAEGVPETFGDWGAMRFPGFESHLWDNMRFDEQWKMCWDSIYTKDGERWEDSPWVWAITYRLLEGAR